MPKFITAPPTRFGSRTAQLLSSSGGGKSGIAPPPTRFAPAAFQPKLGPAQRSTVASPPTRFGPQTTQLKTAPQPSRGPVRMIQRMSDSESEDEYPLIPPPTPLHYPPEYYAEGMDYYQTRDVEAFDAYAEKYEKHSGETVGMSLGSGESEDYDSSYVDIPIGVRPAAPKALWNIVYAGLTPKNTKVLRVHCAELGDGFVEVDAKTKCELGTSKRPPMCHIIPFNHIKWAVQWLFDNKGSKANPYAQTYKGPDAQGLDSVTYTRLVWDAANLQPGHATCNSQTARQAVGVPAIRAANAAVAYVGPKLKSIQPGWF